MSEKARSAEETVLLRLLRGQPLGPALSACTISGLSKLALRHKIIALLADRIISEKDITSAWKRWAAITAIASERDALLCSKAAKKTVALLEGQGIVPIVLKGQSLAFGKVRDAGDVDLLVPVESLIDAITLLESAGYVYRGFERNAYIRYNEYRDWQSLMRWSNQFEFEETETGVLVELHTAFFETGRVYPEVISRVHSSINEFIAASITDAGTGFRVLSLEDRIILLALHAGIKRSPATRSFIMRQLTDLQNLIGASPDWTLLKSRALHFGIAHHVAFLFRLMEFFAGSCAPEGFVDGIESILPRPLLRLQRLHLRCLRDIDTYDPASIFCYGFISPFILKSTLRARVRSLLVFPLLFPSPHILAWIYGLPARSRLSFLLYFLEPFRLVFRICKKFFRWFNKKMILS